MTISFYKMIVINKQVTVKKKKKHENAIEKPPVSMNVTISFLLLADIFLQRHSSWIKL